MNILFKKEPIFYKIQSSEREVYETECYYLLKVVDFSGRLEKELKKEGYEDMEQVLELLFESHQDAKLHRALMKLINPEKFNTYVSISERSSRESIAVVQITRHRFREKVVEKIKEITRKLFDCEYYDSDNF